jgi:MerR family transcriptional regulator, light-induced transcriptional regulator
VTSRVGTVDGADLEGYWKAVAAGDDVTASAVAQGALERGASVETVLRDLVAATQSRVGSLWAENSLTVSHEHAATAVSETVVHRIAAGLPEPTGGPLLLVACVEREWHSLPALVVTHTLRSWGLRADYLGASSSRDQLVSRILDTGPRAVLLSASLASSLPRVRRQVEAIRGTGTPVVVGGSAFDPAGRRAQALGATAYAATPAAAVGLLGTLPQHVTPAPALRGPGAVEARSVHTSAESIVRDVLLASDAGLGTTESMRITAPYDWRVVLTTFVPHVVDCLVGALLTADPLIVEDARGWLVDVVARRGGDPAAVDVLWGHLAERLREFPEATALLLRH